MRPALVCFGLAAALILWLIALNGCVGWQRTAKTGLILAETTVESGGKAGLDYYHRHCMDVAKACPAGSGVDKSCKSLLECQGQRRLLQTVLDKATLAISAAWATLAVADEDGTMTRLAKVKAVLVDLAKLLSGIVPGGVR